MTDSALHGTGLAAGNDTSAKKKRALGLPARLLLLVLPLPFFTNVGSLLLTADRVVLMIFVIPCFLKWISGKAGRIQVSDLAIFFLWLWSALSLSVIEGVNDAIEAGGIDFVETVGTFLLARCYIRTADDFRAMVRILFLYVAFFAPFAVYEALTGQNVLLDIAGKVWPTIYGDISKEPRWGLDRVTATLSHPILFGCFCGSSVALTYYVLGYKAPAWKRVAKTGLTTMVTFLSLSSGPMTALAGQLALISWDIVLRKFPWRWMLLAGGLFSMITLIELVANRSTSQIFIDYFAFDKHTAYNRLRIWDYGTLSVKNHFLFGIGFGEWERPYFMSGSMDMFWLVPAVRYGFMAGFLQHVAFLALFVPIAFRRDLGPRASAYRTGYLVCMVGFYLAGWTVHYWKSIYLLYIFLLGSGAWLLDVGGKAADAVEDTAAEKPLKPTREVRFRRSPEELLQSRDYRITRRQPEPSARQEQIFRRPPPDR